MSKKTKSLNYGFLMSMDDEALKAHKKAKRDNKKRRAETNDKGRRANYMDLYYKNRF